MHARLISETRIDTNVPRRAMWRGQEIVGDLSRVPGLLESLGCYLVQTSEEPTPQEGYHEESRYAYDDAELPMKIVQTWVEVEDPPPPPRTFRRSYLAQWIRAEGYWPAFAAFLAAPEAANLAFLWEYCTEFDEDNASWPAALAAIKAALSLTDEEAGAMLAFGATGGAAQ